MIHPLRPGAACAAILTLLTPATAQLVWSPAGNPNAPSGRTLFGMEHDPVRGLTYLFGGNGSGGAPTLIDTWRWDGNDWVRLRLAGPPARSGCRMVWDDARQQIVLFGGQGQNGLEGDTWTLDAGGWQQQPTGNATPVTAYATAFDAARGRVVRFGGLDRLGLGASARGETLEWDGSAWQVVANTGPSARFACAMAFDTRRGVAVLFGGGDLRRALADTWEWDGTSWAQVAGTGPQPRGGHEMVWDPDRERVILHGGGDFIGNTFDDTWQWDGRSWQQMATGPARLQGRMVFDTTRREIVQWGGADRAGLPTDTWLLRPTNRPGVGSSGPGCAPPGGLRSLQVDGAPIVGNQDFGLRIAGAPAGTTAFVALSFLPGNNQIVSGCPVHPRLPFEFTSTGLTLSQGYAVGLPIPGDPLLGGVTIHVQGGTLEPGPLFGNRRLTEGLRITIGD